MHSPCGSYAYGNLGRSDLAAGGDLEATMNAEREGEVPIDTVHDRQSLIDATKDNWHSARIDALIKEIVPLIDDNSEGKIIIFGEFSQTLDVVCNALKHRRVEYLQLDGHMSLKERAKTIKCFQDASHPIRVLVSTTQCGGLGSQ